MSSETLSASSLSAETRKMNRASDSAASLANLSLKGNGAAGKQRGISENPNIGLGCPQPTSWAVYSHGVALKLP